jgi:hypothetical protein
LDFVNIPVTGLSKDGHETVGECTVAHRCDYELPCAPCSSAFSLEALHNQSTPCLQFQYAFTTHFALHLLLKATGRGEMWQSIVFISF